jgi:hypothetical protein
VTTVHFKRQADDKPICGAKGPLLPGHLGLDPEVVTCEQCQELLTLLVAFEDAGES